MVLDELNRFLDPLICEVFIAESGSMSSCIESDSTDAIMNGRIVTMGPVHLERVAVSLPGWMIRAGLFFANPQRVFGIEVRYAMIVDVNLRHAIVGCW